MSVSTNQHSSKQKGIVQHHHHHRRHTKDVGESQSTLNHFLEHLKRDKDAKKLMILLTINLGVTFLEFVYGFISNSIGLISDAAHMLFDSTALAVGIYASYKSKLPPNKKYTYGYERFQTLAGFVNGIFLIFIAFHIFVESLERIYDPPVIYSEKMIVVAIIGLVVNIIGVTFFHEHAHFHGGEEGHSCSHHHHKTNAHEHHHRHEDLHHHDDPHSHNHDHHHNNCQGEERPRAIHKSSIEEDFFMPEHTDDTNSIASTANTFKEIREQEKNPLVNTCSSSIKKQKHHDHCHNHDHHIPKHDHSAKLHHQHNHEHLDCAFKHKNEKHKCGHSHEHHDHSHNQNHHHSLEKLEEVSDHSRNENLYGVYLHILADLLGSIGVIVSSILILLFDWHITDAICSAITSLLILLSVVPLLKSSVRIFMQTSPSQSGKEFHKILLEISEHPSVIQCKDPHLWAFTHDKLVCSVILILKDDVMDPDKVAKFARDKLSSIKKIKHLTVDTRFENQSM